MDPTTGKLVGTVHGRIIPRLRTLGLFATSLACFTFGMEIAEIAEFLLFNSAISAIFQTRGPHKKYNYSKSSH